MGRRSGRRMPDGFDPRMVPDEDLLRRDSADPDDDLLPPDFAEPEDIPPAPDRERKNQRKREKRKGKKRKRSRAGTIAANILKLILIVFLILILAGGLFAFVRVRAILREAPEISPSQFIPSEAATYIYDQDGNREQKLTLPEANRDLVSIDRIPEDLQHAVVAIEDERFYQHNGIDPKGILRALVKGIRSGHFSEGASTITQQLLKNSVFPDWVKESTFQQRLKRKIQEQYLALRLEKMLTKEQILEDYLNTINLGAGCYGVQSAAYHYFGKDVSELTLSESAVIAGITQNPTVYNPITHPDKNEKRRTEVLDAMLRQGYITQQQYAQAQADDVYSRIQDNEREVDTTSTVYTFYQDALIGQILQDLQDEKGYTYQQAYKAVYSGGLRIYSAQDGDIQRICDEEFENPANFPSGTEVGIDYALSVEDSSGQITDYGNDDLRTFIRQTDPDFDLMYGTSAEAKAGAEAFRNSVVKDTDTVLGERVTITPQPQASCVIIDPSSGLVKALVGGRGTKEASLTLNRASYTERQPGSTFKILAVYAPALDAAGKTLATVYRDEPYNYEDGTPVKDAEGSYAGDVTVRQAIARSINVAAVKCLTEITPELGFKYAQKFGISTLVDSKTTDSGTYSDIGQTLALGGITYGVTNLELTGAYAAIANGGRYVKPRFYTQVLDMYGNVVLDNSDPKARTVIRDSTAALLTSAMRDVVTDPEGTAYGKIDLGQMPAAGKTGTTSDWRDSWFVGYTPYLACGIWAGYDNNAPLPDEDTYHTYSKTLWNSIMKRISTSETVSAFGMPADVVSVSICSETHMAAAPGCPGPYTEYFAKGTEPSVYCNVHGDGSAVDSTAQTKQTDGMSPDAITIYSSGQTTIRTQQPSGAQQENPDTAQNGPENIRQNGQSSNLSGGQAQQNTGQAASQQGQGNTWQNGQGAAQNGDQNQAAQSGQISQQNGLSGTQQEETQENQDVIRILNNIPQAQ